MSERHDRTKMLIGDEALHRLGNSRVAVFGVGGVGGYAAEALARSGVGSIDLIDADDIAESNLNRQIVALTGNVGQGKAEAMARRIADIDPSVKVTAHRVFYLPESRGDIDFSVFDYVIDAVDTVAAKLDIIAQAAAAGVPVISAMGCGNRLDPSRLQVCDINKTFNDPLSKIMRRKLKDLGIKKLDVVFSSELPVRPGKAGQTDAEISTEEGIATENESLCYGVGNDGADKHTEAGSTDADKRPVKKTPPASMIFVPACAGLMMAGYVCRKLAGI